MIERVERTHKKLGGLHILPWTYNFPKASVLELSYRIRLEPAEGGANTDKVMQGLLLTFGVGNPPDFGLANTGSVLVSMPEQETGKGQWQAAEGAFLIAIFALGHKLEVIKAAGGPLAKAEIAVTERLKIKEEEIAKGATLIEQRELNLAAIETENALAAVRAEIASIEAEKKAVEAELEEHEENRPSGWTPYVSATFDRSFDALRLQPVGPEIIEVEPVPVFELEEQLTIYRPGDVAPTPIVGATTGGG